MEEGGAAALDETRKSLKDTIVNHINASWEKVYIYLVESY